VKDERYVQTKVAFAIQNDCSKTNQSRAKLTAECLWELVYGLSIGDKINLVT